MNRRRFLLGAAVALPLPALAEPPLGVVRDLAGEVRLSGHPVARNTALQPGQTIDTGDDGELWFTVGEDAFFVRPRSRVRLDSSGPDALLLDFLRLVSGGLGATFSRGAPRRLVTPTSTIGIRGTGVYLEATPRWTYACTCFGETELAAFDGAPVRVAARNHAARRIDRDGTIVEAGFERHSSDEIARLESLVGRPNPFQP
ncbi:MAG TPA: hypothetical protein VF211_10865 [Burkholderiales bacterium]